jgi:hypothetical protein
MLYSAQHFPKEDHVPIRPRRSRKDRSDRRARRQTLIGAILITGALFGAVLGIAACTTPTEKSREIHDELVYFKDHRTDQCFAYWMVEGDPQTGVMANVPCDEKVMRLISNGAEAGR